VPCCTDCIPFNKTIKGKINPPYSAPCPNLMVAVSADPLGRLGPKAWIANQRHSNANPHPSHHPYTAPSDPPSLDITTVGPTRPIEPQYFGQLGLIGLG